METHKLYINVKENKLILVTLNEEGLEVNRTSYDIRNSDGSVNKVAFNVMEMVKQELEHKNTVVEEPVEENEASVQEQDSKKQEETLENNDSIESPIKYPYFGEEFEETMESESTISETTVQEQNVEKQEETLENKVLNEKCEIIDEYKPSNFKKLSEKAKKALKTITTALGMVGMLTSCGKASFETPVENVNSSTSIEYTMDTESAEVENTLEAPVEEIPTIEELKSESRYTEITEENVALATKNLIDEFNKNGIEVTSEDALTFVTVANMTHFEQTNQELLSQVLGMDANKEATLSKVGHIIGQVVTLEITDKDQQVDWTKALLNETDKKIAVNAMETVEYCKEIASNQELTEEEKATQIQDEIQERFVKPNYDKTEGYNFSDGTHSALSQEDGADFVTDAIFTGIVLGDNVIKNYVYGSETMDDMMAISGNEDVVSNLMTMIENCKQVEETNQMSR